MAEKDKALGKGLSALISDDALSKADRSFIPDLPAKKIKPNPRQPRMTMNPEELTKLADSIRRHGVIEPVIVKKAGEDDYTLIVGERRLRAVQLAGMETIPAVIKDATPQQMLELAVVENIQRADLNPLEEAVAFQQLRDDFGLSVALIAEKVGLSREAVANKVRLLRLPDKVKEGLLSEETTEGHARALLGLTNEQALLGAYRVVVRDHLTVRGAEELVRRLCIGHKKSRRKSSSRIIDEKTRRYENGLEKALGRKVKLSRSRQGGKLVIKFKNDAELDDIFYRITKGKSGVKGVPA